jgi:outer membrane lipoprotein carrier protein
MMPRVSASLLPFLLSGVLIITPWAMAGAEDQSDDKALQEVREVVKKIQARYEQTKDLQADFTQKTRIEGFATPVTSSGRVYIKKPGRLRWDYLDPTVEEIYVNKDDVRMYVPEHKQVLVGKLTSMAASQAPLQLLQGVVNIEDTFDIAPVPGKARGEGGIRAVSLVPKQSDSDPTRTVQRIVVEVYPKTYFLKTVSLHEVSGNVATFEFMRLKANTGLKNDLFEFQAPPDVEVVKAPTLSPR